MPYPNDVGKRGAEFTRPKRCNHIVKRDSFGPDRQHARRWHGAVAGSERINVEGCVPGQRRRPNVRVLGVLHGRVPVQMVVGGPVDEQLDGFRHVRAAVAELAPDVLVVRPGVGSPDRDNLR